MEITSILVIADPDDKQQKAIARAEVMAQRYQAKVHVISFTYQHFRELPEEVSDAQIHHIQQACIGKQEQWLKHQLQDYQLPANSTYEVVWAKDITQWVKTYCQINHVDIIVKTGHRTESTFYTPTDWHLMRNGLVPVLLVADKRWRRKHGVLVALDLGSKSRSKQMLNRKLLSDAIYVSAKMEMPLHVCYSVPYSAVLTDLGIVDKKQFLEKAQSKYIKKVKELAGEFSIPAQNIHIKAGNADVVIPSCASDIGADLVVIGSVGRKGLKAKLLGNTAEDVLALLKTNVLIIQP